jgi:hypothetical protein
MRTRISQHRLDRVEVLSLVLRRGAKPADQVDKKAYNSTAQTVDNSNPLLGTICSFFLYPQ